MSASEPPPARRTGDDQARPGEEILLAPELANAVGFGLRHALTKADVLFQETFAPLEITTVQYAVLMSIRHNPGCRPSMLAGLLNVTPNNLVPQIDSLVRRGFIRRSLSVKDRRIRHLRLTPTGERFAEELIRLHAGLHARIEGGIGPERLVLLTELLTRFNRSNQRALESDGAV